MNYYYIKLAPGQC